MNFSKRNLNSSSWIRSFPLFSSHTEAKQLVRRGSIYCSSIPSKTRPGDCAKSKAQNSTAPGKGSAGGCRRTGWWNPAAGAQQPLPSVRAPGSALARRARVPGAGSSSHRSAPAADGASHRCLPRWGEDAESSRTGGVSSPPGGLPAARSLRPVNPEESSSVTGGISLQGARDYGKVINVALRHPPPHPPYIQQPAPR